MLTEEILRNNEPVRPDTLRRAEKYHHLKTWPGYFEAILQGEKTFEIRSQRDRDFREGDYLILNEWNPDNRGYTGRVIVRKVGHIFTFASDSESEKTVVMSLLKV